MRLQKRRTRVVKGLPVLCDGQGLCKSQVLSRWCVSTDVASLRPLISLPAAADLTWPEPVNRDLSSPALILDDSSNLAQNVGQQRCCLKPTAL